MIETTMPELIVSLHKRITKDGKRIAELEAALDEYVQGMNIADGELDKLRRKLTKAEAEGRGWADSFKQAEAALDSFLGPDGGRTVIELRAELAERDQMLELAAIRIAALMGRTTVDAVLADIRARAKEDYDAEKKPNPGCRCSVDLRALAKEKKP